MDESEVQRSPLVAAVAEEVADPKDTGKEDEEEVEALVALEETTTEDQMNNGDDASAIVVIPENQKEADDGELTNVQVELSQQRSNDNNSSTKSRMDPSGSRFVVVAAPTGPSSQPAGETTASPDCIQRVAVPFCSNTPPLEPDGRVVLNANGDNEPVASFVPCSARKDQDLPAMSSSPDETQKQNAGHGVDVGSRLTAQSHKDVSTSSDSVASPTPLSVPSFLDRRTRRKGQKKSEHTSAASAVAVGATSDMPGERTTANDTSADRPRTSSLLVAATDDNKFPFSHRRSARRQSHSTAGVKDQDEAPAQLQKEQGQAGLRKQHMGSSQLETVSSEDDDLITSGPATLERQVGGRAEELQRRAPFTADLRRSLSRANNRARPQQQQQYTRENLVVAYPVDVEATRSSQQRERPGAQLGATSPSPSVRAIPEGAEFQEQVRAGRFKKQVRRATASLSFSLLVVVSAGVAFFVTFYRKNNEAGHGDTTHCFSTTQELRDTADRLMVLRVQNRSLIFPEIEQVYGPIERWCVSDIEDFSQLFSIERNPKMFAFNLDITNWDMSAATNTSRMFSGIRDENNKYIVQSRFNRDISMWAVGRVVDMSFMFAGASAFDKDLSSWDVAKVKTMRNTFDAASAFNQPLATWDVSNVVDMEGLFNNTLVFDQDLSSWDVSQVQSMNRMFQSATVFNHSISGWNVSNVKDMAGLFHIASSFDQDISSWDVSGVEDMSGMFQLATSFNRDISVWDVGKVKNFGAMFNRASSFDQDISSWDVSESRTLGYMFYQASSFNQNISRWDTAKVKDMSYMFALTESFNQDIADWDLSSVETMFSMFLYAPKFNQNVCNWGTTLKESANVQSMFFITSCPSQMDPDFADDPPGPFCHPCS